MQGNLETDPARLGDGALPEVGTRRRRFTRAEQPPAPATATTVGLPPGPRRPAAVQTLEWVVRPDRFMRRCARRYGTAFTARLGPSTNVVFLSTPAAVKAVFHGPPEHMHLGDINGLFRRVLGQNSLLVIDGDVHLRQRKLLLPPFHGDRIRQHYGEMLAAAEEDVASWPLNEPFPLQPRMQAMTLSVILRVVFGLEPGPRRDEFRDLLARFLDLNTTLATTLPQLRVELGGLTPWARMLACMKQVDRAVYAEIERRRAAESGPTDVLSLLLDARDDEGRALSDQELRDQLLTLLIAGHETTATALSWAFERVLRHPAVLERIRAEIAEGDTTYLDAAIKESLRLRPTLPITARKLTIPYEIDGNVYPAGTVLMPCIYLLHRNPDVYEAPDEFRPERFLGTQPPPYSYIPFGGGVRRCLGAGFGLAEMRAVMSVVLSRVELSPATAADERVTRRSFTLSPGDGASVVATRLRS